MNALTPETPVGDLVAEDPRRARLFERLGIDYCCRGQTPLDRACRENGLDVVVVVRQLAVRANDAECPRDEHGPFDGATATMGALIDHIVTTHHAYLNRELPRLADMSRKVVDAHGNRHPELLELGDLFQSLQEELRFHMLKEEKILFPVIARLELAMEVPELACGNVGNPITVMEHEHAAAGAILTRLRALTDGYNPPADACPTYHALLRGLAELEVDLHMHIHEENNVLFPRARAAERALQDGADGSDRR
jgi:regulator of cell morphogenesis and NO signaling